MPCVHSDPLESRHRGKVGSTRGVLGEMPVKDERRGGRSEWGEPSHDVVGLTPTKGWGEEGGLGERAPDPAQS